MDVFKDYDHIFLTTVVLMLSFSTFTVAVCTLPTEVHNSVWNYQYTNVANNAQITTTLTFGRTTLTKPSNIRLNALGSTLDAWTCISNVTLSSAVSVAVFKSDTSYSDFNGKSKWVYLCMKLTKVADDFFYFYLLSDEDNTVFPTERVYQSGSILDNTFPVCSTFCQYTTRPRIRTLKKSGSSATLPGDVSLCEPCDSACEEATTEMTSMESTNKTTLPPTSTEIDITTDITSTETTQKTTLPSTSTEINTTTEIASTETTQKTTLPATSTNLITTTQQSTIHIMFDDTETNIDINVPTTDKTTIDTLSTDTENLKIYSGPIIIAVIASFGSLSVIITFVYLKGHSGLNTEEMIHGKGEEAYGITPEIFYLYKGEEFGFQKIAIQHWDCH